MRSSRATKTLLPLNLPPLNRKLRSTILPLVCCRLSLALAGGRKSGEK